MNLVTPEKVLEGIREVREGRTFCLTLPLDYPGSNVIFEMRHPPRMFATLRGKLANYNFQAKNLNPDFIDVVCDEAVLLHTQYSTQWDSFAHIGQEFDADGDGKDEIVYYNGWRAGEHVMGVPQKPGALAWDSFEGVSAKALGIENLATSCVQGRAVMIDLHAHYGRERRAIGYDELMRVIEADKIEITPGDMVAVHTGFGDVLLELKKKPTPEAVATLGAGLDGRDQRLLRWITDSGLSILVSDNIGVEYFPPKPGGPGKHVRLPLHEHCLFKLGIHLGELWYLSELARWLREHRRTRFLMTAPPLRLPGAVGSPATPVATV
jgi:hypothetical protein